MVVEYIRYSIPPERAAEFEQAYGQAAKVLDEAPECLSYELSKGVEEPEHYILRIEWKSVEEHEQGFRNSPGFQEFFAAIRPFFNQIDEMKHYGRTAVAAPDGRRSEMPKFMLLFQGLAARPEASDAQTQEYNSRWVDYMGGLARDGKLESGAPLVPSGKVLMGQSVSDLELAEFDLGGYMLLEADSIDEAVEIALRAPHVELGGGTIVRPCVDLPS